MSECRERGEREREKRERERSMEREALNRPAGQWNSSSQHQWHQGSQRLSRRPPEGWKGWRGCGQQQVQGEPCGWQTHWTPPSHFGTRLWGHSGCWHWPWELCTRADHFVRSLYHWPAFADRICHDAASHSGALKCCERIVCNSRWRAPACVHLDSGIALALKLQPGFLKDGFVKDCINGTNSSIQIL